MELSHLIWHLHEIPTAKIPFPGEVQNVDPRSLGTGKAECSDHAIQHCTGNYSQCNKGGWEIRGTQFGKCVCYWGTIFHPTPPPLLSPWGWEAETLQTTIPLCPPALTLHSANSRCQREAGRAQHLEERWQPSLVWAPGHYPRGEGTLLELWQKLNRDCWSCDCVILSDSCTEDL